MSDRTQPFDLSVIIPLDDDHGIGEACVESWNAQTHPRSRIQIVIVDPGNQKKLVDRVRKRLAPHDLIVTVRSDNEGMLYDCGTRAGQSDLLFTTEAHCVAEPYAAAELLRVFSDPSVVAVNGGSTHLEPTIIARQQSLLEHKWIDVWPAGHWRTISLRAFGMRRGVYQELGGFHEEHRRFCANAFAAEVVRRGWQLAPTGRAIVRHCNSPTIRDVAVTLHDCARGQIVWRSQLEQRGEVDVADRLIGGLDFWSRRGDLDRSTARSLIRPLIRSMTTDRGRVGAAEKSASALSALPSLTAAAIVGPRAVAWTQRLLLAQRMIACAGARLHRRNLFQAYHRLWCKSFDCGFADYAAAEPAKLQWFAPTEELIPFAAVPDGAVAGFYSRESWGTGGPVIRWSDCVFLLRLQLERGASRCLVLEVRSDIPAGQRCLSAFFNGQTIDPTAIHDETERVTIALPDDKYRTDGRQELVITCLTQRPSTRGQLDSRRLGLAIFAISAAESSTPQ